MLDAPARTVLAAFGCTESAVRLAGGQGATWRSGNIVLKPMFDAEGAIWEAETLTSLPKSGYRIAEPIRAEDGRWTCERWTASRFVEGFSPKGTGLAERLAAARALHADLEDRRRPSHFDCATDPWDLADRIAFGLAEWMPDFRIAKCLERFRRLQAPIGPEWQIIHGDLSGNFLLLDGYAPAIIDFTPKWSPRGFGEAVFAIDVCLWENVPWEAMVFLLSEGESRLLPLAAARRLLEVDTRHRMLHLPDDVFSQVAAYETLAVKLETLTYDAQ